MSGENLSSYGNYYHKEINIIVVVCLVELLMDKSKTIVTSTYF